MKLFGSAAATALAGLCILSTIALGPGPAAAQGGQRGGGMGKAPSSGALPALSPNQMVPYIDTHAHLDVLRLTNLGASINAMIATMDALKIEKSILMPTPLGGIPGAQTYDLAKLMPAFKRFPDRIILMAGPGVLGAAYLQKHAGEITETDRADFRAKAEALAKGPIAGFGEFGIVHLSLPAMGDQHPYESAPGDHPLLLDLADIAAAHGLAIDIHFDLIPRDVALPRHLQNPNARIPNPARLTRNQDAFERFLAHNRGAKIVWAHVGFEPLSTRPPNVVRDFLTRHSNLYMSFRVIKVSSEEDAAALDDRGRLKSDWRQLIVDFPDRFVMGTDTFHQDGTNLRGGTREGYENLHRILAQLPPEIAAKLARENVPRIYRMGTPPAAAANADTDQSAPAATKGFAKKGKGKAKGGANP